MRSETPPLPIAIALVGATASGKTAVSLALSQYIPSEILSADSRQIYRYLDIGTAKPSLDELSACMHHFIDILTPDIPYSAGEFADDAREVMTKLHARDVLPVIVGGSGLYIRALCEGIFQESELDTSGERAALDGRLLKEGRDALYDELCRIDPPSALRYSDKNPRRILRALEYYYTTGIPLSQAHALSPLPPIPFTTYYFGINHPRDVLYERINRRCIDMWESGLVDETQHVLDLGYSRDSNSLNTVGYKEAMCFLEGSMSAAEALAAMQQSTRRYAKRQLTWFRKNPAIQWLSGSTGEIAEQIAEQITRRHVTG
ncbi:MAG: tRNA (adenosine(37)-N6)-dimethylallyltransferase MiaA [Candidatus Kapaibacterium sp.]